MEEFTIRVKDAGKYYPGEFAAAMMNSIIGEKGMGSLGPILAIHGYLGVLDALDSFGERMVATGFKQDPDNPSSILVTVEVGRGDFQSRRKLAAAARFFGAETGENR